MVVALAALSFAPIKFLHPLRVKRLRALNIALLVAWAVLAFVAVIDNLAPGPYVTWPLARLRFISSPPGCCRSRRDVLDLFADVNAWAALLTLTALEVVLPSTIWCSLRF